MVIFDSYVSLPEGMENHFLESEQQGISQKGTMVLTCGASRSSIKVFGHTYLAGHLLSVIKHIEKKHGSLNHEISLKPMNQSQGLLVMNPRTAEDRQTIGFNIKHDKELDDIGVHFKKHVETPTYSKIRWPKPLIHSRKMN